MPIQVPEVAVDEVPVEPTGGQVLLDVREDDEWRAGHAPNAVHIPMGELMARLGELPEDADVFVVCRTGGRSARVTAYLNENGWDAVNVAGGMKAWAATGRPVVGDLADTEPHIL
ncbi:rhodanese-like domain-containing protein [Streptoalloteichus hindustanus]|uniref:Rhodanese-related sulfurtransferase n=1 Tax=Streptoalloteichus hindustanus TaxID=2017 RepID=A0A1M4VBU4_STRHI|nr:rhodanese-like domain-containing protein [Streptoalloteichus hindustanus]SHE66464.1 Rhodanese-related sulfurtransferase [Streptoalloteichus hindustanus]